MSMWLSLARVSPESLATIRANPDLLDILFFEVDAKAAARLGVAPEHCCGVDFLSLSAAHEAMAEAMGEDAPDDVLEADLDPTGELDFDAGYGPGFFLDPAATKAALEGSMVPEMDDEARHVMESAAAEGAALVGVVS